MAIVNQDLYLEITPGTIPPTLNVTEYDENMQVTVHLLQRGQPFQIPSGTTAVVEGTIAGHPFRNTSAAASGNTVTFEFTESMTAFAGRAWTKIKLTKDSKPVSSCGFWLDCDRAGVEAETVIGAPGFQEEINQAVADFISDNTDIYIFRGSMQTLGLTALSDCAENGVYQITTGYSESITDLPADYQPRTAGFAINMNMGAVAWQVIYSPRGIWTRSKSSGSWGAWNRLSDIRAIWTSFPDVTMLSVAKIDGIYQLPSAVIATLSDLPEDYGTGAGLLEVRSNYATGAAVVWQKLNKANGKAWIRTINTSGTASEWASISGNAHESPWYGKTVSVIGDSFSAYAGEIPTGNAVYYTGNNAGVSSPSQMWWSILIADNGMEKGVINAWSGSCVASGVRDDSIYKPASDADRCTNLGTAPDVIICAVGVNDYSYGGAVGDWDGTTVPTDNTTFREAYALMLTRIQTAYPNAAIICCSPWFTQRGSLTGEVYKNGLGLSAKDYSDAVRDVAGIMHCRYIDVEDIGFNRRNYYPTYCEDSSTTPTHPNANGQRTIANAIKAMLDSFSPLEVSV